MTYWDVLNSLVLLTIAIVNIYGIYLARQTHANTNSMKDALVASTAKASRAEGNLEGRAEARAIDGGESHKAIEAIKVVAEAISAPKELVGVISGEVAEKGEEPKPIEGDIKGQIVPAGDKTNGA